jgi:CheY-like chemotaxis protein/HPt (histidine-containing phosphotransfer) domain-containing protein
MLANWGIPTSSCSHGEGALATIKTADAEGRPVNLVLTDAMMPGMDGFELTRRIRDLPAARRPQIIMLSSAGSRTGTKRTEGVARHLVKPVKQSSLFDAMIEIMGPVHRHEAVTQSAEDAGPALAILLAEDNRVNQAVARGILERRGHAVTLAEDGREAVEAFAEDRFDVILMDIQMPHLNGFEATAAIRERERAWGGHVPIIAMTANAMKGDREKCLDAGMDDYVHKPVRAKTLHQALERNAATADEPKRELAVRSAIEAVAAKGAAPGDEDGPVEVEADVFDAARFRKNTGDDELMRTLLDLFEEEADGSLANIDKAVVARDAEALHHAAHALKGMVGNFSADRVFNCIRDLDDKARHGELEGACRMVPDAKSELAQLRAALKAFRQSLD